MGRWTDFFEGLRIDVQALDIEEERYRELEEGSGSKGTNAGSVHGGSSKDALARKAIKRAEIAVEIDRLRADLEPRLTTALIALYGNDATEGLAERRGTADADCICGYYVMGLGSWAKVASELVQPDGTAHADDWCRMRAKRALAWMDRNL